MILDFVVAIRRVPGILILCREAVGLTILKESGVVGIHKADFGVVTERLDNLGQCRLDELIVVIKLYKKLPSAQSSGSIFQSSNLSRVGGCLVRLDTRVGLC